MRTGFIGAGKVGCTLGKYFTINGIEVSGFYSRNLSSAQFAAELTGKKAYKELSEIINDSDTLFITVPDGAVRGVYEQLTKLGINGKVLCHCSGSMTSREAFPDIDKYGAYGCSVHPLFPISSRTDSYKVLSEAFFCIEGDREPAGKWRDIIRSMGNTARMIAGESKSSYHAACAIMSNLVCGLAQTSLELLKGCGFTEKEALAALRPLAENNIKNIFENNPSAALTGPVERNDVGTIKKHLDCIPEGIDSEIYKCVSLKLTELAQLRHPDSDYSELIYLLDDIEKE